MSTATPMRGMDRAHIYWLPRRRPEFTARQARRFRQKEHAEVGRLLVELQRQDPEVVLCGHHVRVWCPCCLMCRTCDGCECQTFEHLSPWRFQ